MTIKQAVIPAAGLGSKFLPVSKVVPKELLPLLGKPSLQHLIEEGVSAGVEEFIIVISEEKRLIESYFQPSAFLDQWLLGRHLDQMHQEIKALEKLAHYKFVIQDKPLGLGHAVLCARSHIVDEHFFVILPDDIIDADVPVCRQMQEIFSVHHVPVVSTMEVSWDEVHRYGIIKADPLSEYLGDVTNIVEKPARQEAPSNLAVMGRYILPRDVFKNLETTKPGAGGKIQLTDALREIIPSHGLQSFLFKGERFDISHLQGLLMAETAMSIKHPVYGPAMRDLIKALSASV